MSKQDIEKRLGFAAQGVKETTRSSAKAKMAKRMIVDTITSGNQKHELGYESVMQSLTAGEPPHEWFRPIVRTTNLDTGKSSEKASQPHYTEKSARDWLKNYASSVKPSTDPLYAEYASNREKISKMMTRLAQARNNPELRQKLQAESDKLDARQREVAAQLQKRKSSRPGAKSKFVRVIYTPQGSYRTELNKDTRVPIEGGKGYVMVDPAQYITPKRVRVQGTKGEIEVRAIVEGKEIVGVSAKLVSARPGAKAKMETPMRVALTPMHTRAEQGYENFIAVLMKFGGITREQAQKAFKAFKDAKVLVTKEQYHGGGITVKHGAFMERDVIRRAAGLPEESSRPGAKAKMAASFEDRQRAAGYKWQVRYTKQLGKTDSYSAMEIDETLAFATESAARKWADTMIKKGWYKGISGTPEKVLTAKVVPFARPGVKAKA